MNRVDRATRLYRGLPLGWLPRNEVDRYGEDDFVVQVASRVAGTLGTHWSTDRDVAVEFSLFIRPYTGWGIEQRRVKPGADYVLIGVVLSYIEPRHANELLGNKVDRFREHEVVWPGNREGPDVCMTCTCQGQQAFVVVAADVTDKERREIPIRLDVPLLGRFRTSDAALISPVPFVTAPPPVGSPADLVYSEMRRLQEAHSVASGRIKRAVLVQVRTTRALSQPHIPS